MKGRKIRTGSGFLYFSPLHFSLRLVLSSETMVNSTITHSLFHCFSGRRRLLLDSLDVVVMQDGVEKHRELAVILPAVARIGRKKDHAPFARRNVNNGGTIAGFGDAAHQSAQH